MRLLCCVVILFAGWSSNADAQQRLTKPGAAAVKSRSALAGRKVRTKSPITVFFLRHAEKKKQGSNPDLSNAGKQRAQSLIHVLGTTGAKYFYATQFKRTQQTVKPLASHLKTRVSKYTAANSEMFATRKLLKLPGGSVAVVVGHSNTVPQMIAALTGNSTIQITESQFDRLFVVTLLKGKSTLVELGY